MTNREAVERLGQSHNARIEKLFWIASQMEESDLKDFLEYLTDKEWKELFPEIKQDKYFKEYLDNEDYLQLLCDYDKFGLLAEINIPECDNFQYKNGKPVSWSVHSGCCRIIYAYGETLEELVQQIEKKSQKMFKKYLEKDKHTTAVTPNNQYKKLHLTKNALLSSLTEK